MLLPRGGEDGIVEPRFLYQSSQKRSRWSRKPDSDTQLGVHEKHRTRIWNQSTCQPRERHDFLFFLPCPFSEFGRVFSNVDAFNKATFRTRRFRRYLACAFANPNVSLETNFVSTPCVNQKFLFLKIDVSFYRPFIRPRLGKVHEATCTVSFHRL